MTSFVVDPLLENETVIELDPDADFLTKRITERAVSFIERNKNEPFFLYFSTTLHHGPAPWANQFSLDADPRMTGEGFVAEGFDVLFHNAVTAGDLERVGYLAPIASNFTAEGRAANRRVEAILSEDD